MTNDPIKDILDHIGTQDVPVEAHKIADQACSDFVKDLPRKRKSMTLNMWETIMRSGMTKLAAVIVVMVSVFVILFSKVTVPSVYALEKTLEALHSVRYLHMKFYRPDHEEPKESWIACDTTGQIIKARMYMPAWASPDDGAKDIVWSEGRAQIWIKRKNSVVTVWEQHAIEQLEQMVTAFDPKARIEQLIKLEEEGVVALTFEEPKDKAQPIIVTVDYLDGRNELEVLTINHSTLLMERTERFTLKDGEFHLVETYAFLDYNQAIDDTMFQLDEVPTDAMHADQTAPDVGLPKGALSDTEVAEKVARTFFEALIAKDFVTVGRLYGGVDGSFLQKKLEDTGIEFVRIISLGPAQPHPIPETRGLVVPAVLEVKVNGQLETMDFNRLGIRPVYGQPDRWAIFGGF